jgi:hypothetical protein
LGAFLLILGFYFIKYILLYTGVVMFKISLIIATSVITFGCASSYPERASKSASYGNETTIETNSAGVEVICRKKTSTGSRVRVTERCATQAQWDAFDEEVSRRMKDMTNSNTTRTDGAPM